MKPLPSVAIIGRPNVGKSTLFNRITQRRRAIVHESPGVTRDIQKGAAEWNGVHFDLIDTGGLFSGIDDSLIGQVEARAIAEAEQADAIIFVVDGNSGPVPGDDDVARRVREMKLPVIVAVNKSEKLETRQAVADFYRLGFQNVHGVSALHGEGTGDMLDELVAMLPTFDPAGAREDLRLAVIGVPNVGKSSLINALVGEDANIVDSRPGTTRDSIDITLSWHGRRVTLVDTAGIKRKARTPKGVETLSAIKSLESIERCDVAVFMLDASRKITTQDVKVGSYPHRAGRGVLACFNKWDLVEKEDKTYREMEKDFRHRFGFLAYAPILFISVEDRQRLNKIIETAWHIKEQREQRVATADFNRFLEALVSRNPPPFHGGGSAKIYYGTQVEIEPPTFALFVNKGKYFGRNYLRFLNNQLRRAFPFDGTLIRINLIEKKAREEVPE